MRSDLAQMAARVSRPKQPSTPGRNWDATKSEAPAELLQKSFELACFLVPDRSVAIDTLVRALEKLRVRSRREIKRLYWRDKHTERPVRRMVRCDMDMLQWLIMFEAEEGEKAHECTGSASLRDMVTRYIKHLVQVTTPLSAFYVNVGLTRLLHSYNTSEAQQVYEILTCRYPGSDEYRRAKAFLMDNVNQRFAGLVRVTRVDRGELRFETLPDQERWAGLVNDCLRAFTPWSTHCMCSQPVTATRSNFRSETADRPAGIDKNEMEMQCCHILIEPTCYSRLLQDLDFDPPDAKLAVPRFVMPEKQETSDDHGSQRARAPELSQDELDQIQRRLATSDARRSRIDPRSVTLVIDGVDYAQLHFAQKKQLQIEIKAGASLIEIRGEDDHGDLLLATHLISYANNAFEPSLGTAMLSKGKLKFAVMPVANRDDDPPRAVLSLVYKPRLRWIRPWSLASTRSDSRRAIRWYALTGLTMAFIVWGAASLFYGHKIKLLENKFQQAHGLQQQLLPTTARAIMSYTLTRDDQRIRGVDVAGIPEISQRLHSPAISLELPMSRATEDGGYSAELKTFSGDQTLLTINFLQATRTDTGSSVEIVVPSGLLKADTYYTVHLHSTGRTEHFTFRVVAE